MKILKLKFNEKKAIFRSPINLFIFILYYSNQKDVVASEV